jgi:hypothetical protein
VIAIGVLQVGKEDEDERPFYNAEVFEKLIYPKLAHYSH